MGWTMVQLEAGAVLISEPFLAGENTTLYHNTSPLHPGRSPEPYAAAVMEGPVIVGLRFGTKGPGDVFKARG